MAFGMNELASLSKEDQEEVLKKLSSQEKCPIEIDNQVYYIPVAVNRLIDMLYRQSCEFPKGENGLPPDKE
jgi:hypothetical protein|tara:strand:+ start:675 stop:887 length:213 start_codon:yes stop_codon:yes gene_type:complete